MIFTKIFFKIFTEINHFKERIFGFHQSAHHTFFVFRFLLLLLSITTTIWHLTAVECQTSRWSLTDWWSKIFSKPIKLIQGQIKQGILILFMEIKFNSKLGQKLKCDLQNTPDCQYLNRLFNKGCNVNCSLEN